MHNFKNALAQLLLQELKTKLQTIENEKLRLICEAYVEQLVPEVVEQLVAGTSNLRPIQELTEAQARKELKAAGIALLFKALEKVNEKLPDGKAKALLNNEILDIAQSGWNAFMDKRDWQVIVEEKAKGYAANYAKDFSHEAIDKIRERFPENQYCAAICDDADKLAVEIVDQLAAGDDFEYICQRAKNSAEATLKKQGSRYAKEKLNASIDFAIDFMASKAREKGRGKRHSRYNKRIDAVSNIARNSLKDNVNLAVDRLLAGESVDEVIEGFATDTAKQMAGDMVTQQAAPYVSNIVRQGAKSAHVSGKGSRKINKHIDALGGEAADSLASNLSNNVIEVISGNKDVGEALKDTAIDTAKETARNYLEKHGAELAKEGIEAITKSVAKQMGNKAAKEAVLAAGAKLANVNAVTAVAGAVIDIGTCFKAYLDGKITKAQLLRQIGEKGSSACISTAWGIAGGMVGGPVGAAIGSMIGYVASSMLYGSVLKAFEDEDAARVRAEQTHAFCEAAIKQMRREREEFERYTQELFNKRDEAARRGFEAMERAVLGNDFDKFSAGLNEIAMSFGKQLQFTTFEEFDAFMESDEDFDL